MPHTKAEEMADDIIMCVIQSEYNLDGVKREQYDELLKAVSDKLASLLADKKRGDKLVKLLTEYLAMPSIDGNIRRNELRHKLIQAMKEK